MDSLLIIQIHPTEQVSIILISLWTAMSISSFSGNDDFDGTMKSITFPADGVDSVFIMDAPVAIVDDEINEAQQFFVVLMEVVDAVNPKLLNNTDRNISMCTILDNDGE